MTPDRECRKKDKRLLVLLAFGVLVIILSQKKINLREEAYYPPKWLELQGENSNL